MKKVHIPCKNCISYARCITKDMIECSILFDELKAPNTIKEMVNSNWSPHMNNNNEKLRAFTEYLKHRTFILGFSTIYIFRANPLKPFKGDNL